MCCGRRLHWLRVMSMIAFRTGLLCPKARWLSWWFVCQALWWIPKIVDTLLHVFEQQWDDLLRSSKVVVFCCFVEGRLISRCARGGRNELDVRCGEGVWDCHVPGKWFTAWPRYKGRFVRSLSILVWQADRILASWDLNFFIVLQIIS